MTEKGSMRNAQASVFVHILDGKQLHAKRTHCYTVYYIMT